MSVYDLYFAFGKPGTYFLDHTKDYCEQRLPKSYREWVKDKPLQTLKSLAMNDSDTIFMSWEDTKGHNQAGYSRNLKHEYPDLYDFIHEHGGKKCRVAFGSEPGDFVVVVPETGRAAWNHTNINANGILRTYKRAKHCSLGVNGAYVVVWADGSVDWSVKYGYAELDKILRKTKQGDVVFVALNPYRSNEFFIALADGIVHIRASALAERHVLNTLRDYPKLKVITSSVAKQSQSLSSKLGFSSSSSESQTKEFTKFIMKEVAGGVISTAIAATLSCTVM